MPRYPKACHNRHFHEKWSSGQSDLSLINLRRNGLSDLAKTFESFLKGEHGIRSPTVTSAPIASINASTSGSSKNIWTEVMLK